MLQTIVGAQQSITFETNIYWSGDVGKQFADALAEGARARVKVHGLLDRVGSESMQLRYQPTITAAERTIDLSMAYFVPEIAKLSVYDAESSERQTRVFEQDIARARRVSLGE